MNSRYLLVYDARDPDGLRHLIDAHRSRGLAATCGSLLSPRGNFTLSDGTGGKLTEITCPKCLVDVSVKLANEAHRGQIGWDGKPLFDHVQRVAEAIEESGEDSAVISTALLHDVIGEASMTPGLLREHFIPQDVVEAVWLVTRKSDVPGQEYLSRIGSETAGPSGRYARRVKFQSAWDEFERSREKGDDARAREHADIVKQIATAMERHGEMSPEAWRDITGSVAEFVS